MNPDAFGEIPLEDRFGMTQADVRRTKDYFVALAFPLFPRQASGERKMMGVLAVHSTSRDQGTCLDRATQGIDVSGYPGSVRTVPRRAEGGVLRPPKGPRKNK